MKLNFYFNNIIYVVAGLAAAVFLLSFLAPAIFQLGFVIIVLLLLLIVVDTVILYSVKEGVNASRIVPDRFSIGDENGVEIFLQNRYNFPVQLTVIDELPYQFQARDWFRSIKLSVQGSDTIRYFLTPKERGEYVFHDINVFVQGPLKFVTRRFVFSAVKTVKVYPSYIQMRKYQLLAISNRLENWGSKMVRKVGHSLEFEQIKEYVKGDDYRTINWSATAKKGNLMVNNYTDEKSQQVYCLINKGRVMKMPFNGMTLLDYSINAALVLLNVALVKHDKAGLITFSEMSDSFLQADKKPAQMNRILEVLYRQQTKFQEPDYEKLFSVVRHRIANRSLLVLFTNFESVEGLQRELPALRKMAAHHLLLVVFFENTELKKITDEPADSLEGIYIKTIAEKFAYEKRLMVKELQMNGITSILTTPDKLTLSTINKYIELKNRNSI